MWEVFKNWIFDVIQLFYNFCGDWGLAIVIVTIIFRLIISPLMHSQSKSNHQMQKMQPLMTEIQTNYADDPVRMQEEMQKLYAEAKFNPMAGCLPMLLQMPIFIALFQVLRTMDERVSDSTYEFYGIIPDLTMTPSGAFSEGIVTFIPYLVLMIIFAGATFLPMLLQQRNTPDSQQKTTTLMTAAIMSIFMLFISWSSPAGVLLFWGTSSLIAVAQQQGSLAIMKKQDKDAEEANVEEKPVKVDVVRKEKKKRPRKKR